MRRHPNKQTQKKELIEIRRKYVIDYLSQGLTQREIASHLKCSVFTVNHDIAAIRSEAQHDIHKYTYEVLPTELQVQLAGLNKLIAKQYSFVNNPSTDPRIIQSATQIIQQAYRDRMELISSATLISKVMRDSHSSGYSDTNNDDLEIEDLDNNEIPADT